MEFLIFIVVVVAVLGWFIWKGQKLNESSSHSSDGATNKSVLDVNNDGQVDLKDAVAAAEVVAEVVVEETKKTVAKTKAVAKTTAAKIKSAVKKPVVKKPAAKKTKK